MSEEDPDGRTTPLITQDVELISPPGAGFLCYA